MIKDMITVITMMMITEIINDDGIGDKKENNGDDNDSENDDNNCKSDQDDKHNC